MALIRLTRDPCSLTELHGVSQDFLDVVLEYCRQRSNKDSDYRQNNQLIPHRQKIERKFDRKDAKNQPYQRVHCDLARCRR